MIVLLLSDAVCDEYPRPEEPNVCFRHRFLSDDGEALNLVIFGKDERELKPVLEKLAEGATEASETEFWPVPAETTQWLEDLLT